MGLRQIYVRWLPLLLGATVVANFAVLNWVPRSGQPLRTHPDSSLTHLVDVEGVSLARRYGFYFAIGDAADGAVVVVQESSGVRSDWLRGLSGLTTEVQDISIDSAMAGLFPSEAPSGEVTLGEEVVPYWILEGEADRWWIARTDRGLFAVPSSLAPVPELS